MVNLKWGGQKQRHTFQQFDKVIAAEIFKTKKPKVKLFLPMWHDGTGKAWKQDLWPLLSENWQLNTIWIWNYCFFGGNTFQSFSDLRLKNSKAIVLGKNVFYHIFPKNGSYVLPLEKCSTALLSCFCFYDIIKWTIKRKLYMFSGFNLGF